MSESRNMDIINKIHSTQKTTPEPLFKAGDIVRIKGQPLSPAMTVNETSNLGADIYCVLWDSEKKVFKREKFKKEALEKVAK